MRTGRNNKNGGFSLVELIIVVAIMAIVVGVIGLSVGTLTGRKIAKCADEIVSTLERARVLTLGKEQNQVEFVLTDVSGEVSCADLSGRYEGIRQNRWKGSYHNTSIF